jgi:cytoskeletal protein CcmA (bactofilin family)
VMMINMNIKSNKKTRPGFALLVVLFIVMAITILSLGFVTRSDVELTCGQNMILRTQMDYLAESGLEHARGLILNPQDVVGSEYWTGGTGFQLVFGSDYYDISVTRDAVDLCNYIIDCNSYQLEGADTIGLSSMQATLRIDPCIAYWAGSNTTVWPQVTVNGDVYCAGDLTNNGDINGDVFAIGTITGTANIEGQSSTVTQAPVDWPGLISTDFGPTYYINSTLYSAEPNLPVTSSGPSAGNPAGIRYCAGDVNMPGGITINGTLVVTGNLTIMGTNTITAVKSFPALVVGGQLVMKDNSSLSVNGLAQVEQQITNDPNTTNANIEITGGLFIHTGDITSNVISVNINANPARASLETWPAMDTSSRWSPAAGAFFRSIQRR